MKSKILDMLRTADGYISGEKISNSLNISRTAVWKHINALRKDGFEIESVTNRGYRLISSPDIIAAHDILSALNTEFIGRNIICLDETDSTNNECKRNSGLADGTVYTSEMQSGGKGRRGNPWSSPKGCGAWFSILLKPEIPPYEVSKITLIAGLAVCRAFGNGAMIKYPNDIVIGTKKVCGILTELSAETDCVNYVVCGIGVNVNTPSFGKELSEKATSLFIESKKKYPRSKIIADILNEFEPLYKSFLKNGLASVIDDYKKRCITLNSAVNVTYNKTTVQGICTDIKADGSIEVTSSDGVITVNSGEVSVRGIYGYV